MGLRYNVEVRGAHFRYFFFTLTATAAVLVARGHGQIASEARAFLVASERPSYANFGLVRIDPDEDAEAVAGVTGRVRGILGR
jgi:hypothetical protein